jgi:hypothetical protein
VNVIVQIAADARDTVPLLAGLLRGFHVEVAFDFPNQFGELTEGHAQIVAKKSFLRYETGIYLEGVEDTAESFVNGVHRLSMVLTVKGAECQMQTDCIWKDFAKLRKLFCYKKFPRLFFDGAALFADEA